MQIPSHVDRIDSPDYQSDVLQTKTNSDAVLNTVDDALSRQSSETVSYDEILNKVNA